METWGNWWRRCEQVYDNQSSNEVEQSGDREGKSGDRAVQSGDKEVQIGNY